MDMHTLHKISYGMYVVSSRDNDKFNGQISNTVMQVTADPPKLSVCINKENLTHQYISKSNIFIVSILEKDTPLQVIGNFGFKSGRKIDKFKDIEYKLGETGVPFIIPYCLGFIECEVEGSTEVGTHTIFTGKVIDAQVLKEGEPMTYAYYHEIKGGKSPKTAPTYIDEKKQSTAKLGDIKKYKCKVCNDIYDPEKGDSDTGTAPGKPFEKLPDDWVCPVCGAGKEEFKEI